MSWKSFRQRWKCCDFLSAAQTALDLNYFRNNYQVSSTLLPFYENVINIRLPRIRYSFENIFPRLLPPRIPEWMNEKNTKSSINQFYVSFIRLPFSTLLSLDYIRLQTPREFAVFFRDDGLGFPLTAPERIAKADAVYWVKLSMKYFDIPDDSSCYESLRAACVVSFILSFPLRLAANFPNEMKNWNKKLNFNFHLVLTLFFLAIKSRLRKAPRGIFDRNVGATRWYLTIGFAEFWFQRVSSFSFIKTEWKEEVEESQIGKFSEHSKWNASMTNFKWTSQNSTHFHPNGTTRSI